MLQLKDICSPPHSATCAGVPRELGERAHQLQGDVGVSNLADCASERPFQLDAVRFKLVDVLTYGSITVLQGFIGGLLLLIRRKLRFESSGLSMAAGPGRGSTDPIGLRQGAYFLFVFWLLAPMLIGQSQGNFVDAAFRALSCERIMQRCT